MYTVLLVDDEKGIIDGLNILMKRYLPECDVIGCAYDGIEGYHMALDLRPDIIITDIRMLKMDGLKMIEMLVDEEIYSKFILLSGYSEFEYARKAMSLGVKFYLNKPVEEEELQDCVRSVIHVIDNEKEGEENTQQSISVEDEDSIIGKVDLITEIKQYISDNFEKKISLTDLSNRFFINSYYLSQLFKNKTGQNYLDYLTQVRIERAKDLLQRSELRIYEICEMVGYTDTTHFSKTFEKNVGYKPSEYRQVNNK